jgi:hypothetical protein
MKNTVLFVLSGSALTIAAIACTTPPKEPHPGVETTSAGVVSNKDAIARITQSRCDRAQRCSNFGVGKDYADMAGCKSQVGHDVADEFRPRECPHGVREERLNTCVGVSASDSCGNVGDNIKRTADCRKSELCIE